ncbi:hypothetical protein ACGF5M_06375 [Gemmatimonadota bacterium]
MQRRVASMVLVLLLTALTNDVGAQEVSRGPWTISAGLSVAAVMGESDWTVSHPFYGNGGVTWETLRGTVSHGLHFQGSVEVRRKYVGVRGRVGILGQEFTQEASEQSKDLRLLLGGLSAVLYPFAGSATRLEPYFALEAGGQKATGDMDNTGFYLSASSGFRTRLSSRISLDGGIELHRLKYAQVDLGNSIEKDLHVTPLSLFVGLRIGG